MANNRGRFTRWIGTVDMADALAPPAGNSRCGRGKCGSGAVVWHTRGDPGRVVDTVLRPGAGATSSTSPRHPAGHPEEKPGVL